MVNLILDTQTWLYLANGYNQKTSKHEELQHFKLLEELKKLKETGKIRLLVNSVIIEEWARNKESTRVLVNKYVRNLESTKEYFKGVKRYLPLSSQEKLDDVYDQFKLEIENEISKNEKHILEIEDLLKNKSKNIEISDQIRIEVSKLAEHKKAPFHNKNNSVNDALILLSAVDYLKNNHQEFGWVVSNSIFISNNSSDYCDKLGSNEVHPDLKRYFNDAGLEFQTNLGRALNLGREIIAEIDEYNDYVNQHVTYCLAHCGGDDYYNFVYYDHVLKFQMSDYELIEYNPNQLQFAFEDENLLTLEKVNELNKNSYITLQAGNCQYCNTLHFQCLCEEEHFITDDSDSLIDCSCGARIKTVNGKLIYAAPD